MRIYSRLNRLLRSVGSPLKIKMRVFFPQKNLPQDGGGGVMLHPKILKTMEDGVGCKGCIQRTAYVITVKCCSPVGSCPYLPSPPLGQ